MAYPSRRLPSTEVLRATEATRSANTVEKTGGAPPVSRLTTEYPIDEYRLPSTSPLLRIRRTTSPVPIGGLHRTAPSTGFCRVSSQSTHETAIPASVKIASATSRAALRFRRTTVSLL